MTISVSRRGPVSFCSRSAWACLESGLLVKSAWVVRAPARYLEVSNPPTRNSAIQMPMTVKRRRALQRDSPSGESLMPCCPAAMRAVQVQISTCRYRPVGMFSSQTSSRFAADGAPSPLSLAGGPEYLEEQVEAADDALTEIGTAAQHAGDVLSPHDQRDQDLGHGARGDVGADVALVLGAGDHRCPEVNPHGGLLRGLLPEVGNVLAQLGAEDLETGMLVARVPLHVADHFGDRAELVGGARVLRRHLHDALGRLLVLVVDDFQGERLLGGDREDVAARGRAPVGRGRGAAGRGRTLVRLGRGANSARGHLIGHRTDRPVGVSRSRGRADAGTWQGT